MASLHEGAKTEGKNNIKIIRIINLYCSTHKAE